MSGDMAAGLTLGSLFDGIAGFLGRSTNDSI